MDSEVGRDVEEAGSCADPPAGGRSLNVRRPSL